MDIRPGAGSSLPEFLGVLNGRLLFHADNGSIGREWWIHDPAAGTTTLVKDINPGSGSSDSGWVAMGGFAYMLANGGAQGRQLWRTDGTANGTTLVKVVNPSGSAFPTNGYVNACVFGVLNGNRLLFRATDGTSGMEVWISDGTEPGTRRLADINPGSASSDPSGFTELGGWSYFSANDGTHGRELWRTDGTVVEMVADAHPGTTGLNPAYLCRVGDELFFIGNDGIHGVEPWGYANGTMRLLKDINPGSATSYPVSGSVIPSPYQTHAEAGTITVSGTTVYFAASAPEHGQELWAYTADSTVNQPPSITVPASGGNALLLP
jgi:ELWxxDGT repeat protein